MKGQRERERVTENRFDFHLRASFLAKGRKEQKFDAFFSFNLQTYLVAARGAARVHEPIGMAHLSVFSRWASWRERKDGGNCDGAQTEERREKSRSSARSRRSTQSTSRRRWKEEKELVRPCSLSLSRLFPLAKTSEAALKREARRAPRGGERRKRKTGEEKSPSRFQEFRREKKVADLCF